MLTQREKAIRAAAMIDTDGSIRITTKYEICASFTSIDMVLLNWLQSNYGGSINQSKGRKSKWDQYHRQITYQWKITTRLCEIFLREIEPFLLLKQQQARACLELREWQGHHFRNASTDDKNAIWKPYREWVMALNSNKTA